MPYNETRNPQDWIPVMDEKTVETQETSFGKEIAKAAAMGTVQSAAATAAFLVIGYAVAKFQMKKAEKTKKENNQEN